MWLCQNENYGAASKGLLESVSCQALSPNSESNDTDVLFSHTVMKKIVDVFLPLLYLNKSFLFMLVDVSLLLG